MAAPRLNKAQVDAILKEGDYYRLEDYALRHELCEKIFGAFLDGIGKLAGSACRERVAANGLAQMHQHFPIQKIHLLEAYLMRRLQDELYYWSYRVGADTLGLPDPFYVDHLIVFRIHYPFLKAREAKQIEKPPVQWRERMKLGLAALCDREMLDNYLNKRKTRTEASKSLASKFDPFAYHGAIPVPARSHGPHIDTWYGHSYDGINLWLSIDGVNRDNTVILYPEMFARPMAFDPVSMYIAPGVEISKPQKIELKPGELLVFNPETLHGTQVNISEETRVALTTRINPGQPRFAPDAPFHMEHWYCSDELKQRKFSAVKLFAAAKHPGRPSFVTRDAFEGNRTRRLMKNETIHTGESLAVCSADALRVGEKLAVDFANMKLVLWRSGNEVRAFSRICPHLGIDLADGYHDESQVFCPGHGIAFSLADGRSKCESFHLRRFNAFERDAMIYVEQS
ncbi:MAG: Rieske 2Fe-2S domain-containing protein [Pseudomonadota bacterium]|nr:Rieske 2Fe-2S domain-containing protein [Pseudomonadota bacterium]